MRKITGGINPTGGWQTDTDSSSTTVKMSATASRRARCRYWPLRGCTPIRPANIAAYDGGASPEVATRSGRYVITRVANTARSTLAIAYGTLSADQKPRSVSGDNTPPSTRNRIPKRSSLNEPGIASLDKLRKEGS